MQFSLDLRYGLPPLVNLTILFLTSQSGGVSLPVISSVEFNEYPILKLASLAFTIFLSLLFVFTSIELPLSAHQINVQAGYFSGPLTFLLLSSIILQPNVFWVAYFSIIITGPWHGMLWDLLKRSFESLVLKLKSIPPLVITFTRQEDIAQPEAAQRNPELVAVDSVVNIE